MLCGVQRGILGGTFDPPHLAHLTAGEAAYRDLGLDVVSFLPAGAPWQKAGRVVSAPAHRWAMTQLAVDGVEYFEADDREVRRDGWTYTWDTVATFPDDQITLILGADAARGLPGWHRVSELLDRVRVAVMDRSGIDRNEVAAAVAAPVVWLDAPPLAVSGTMVRERISSDRSARFLVRERVWRYIMDNDMYVTP